MCATRSRAVDLLTARLVIPCCKTRQTLCLKCETRGVFTVSLSHSLAKPYLASSLSPPTMDRRRAASSILPGALTPLHLESVIGALTIRRPMHPHHGRPPPRLRRGRRFCRLRIHRPCPHRNRGPCSAAVELADDVASAATGAAATICAPAAMLSAAAMGPSAAIDAGHLLHRRIGTGVRKYREERSR